MYVVYEFRISQNLSIFLNISHNNSLMSKEPPFYVYTYVAKYYSIFICRLPCKFNSPYQRSCIYEHMVLLKDNIAMLVLYRTRTYVYTLDLELHICTYRAAQRQYCYSHSTLLVMYWYVHLI